MPREGNWFPGLTIVHMNGTQGQIRPLFHSPIGNTNTGSLYVT